MKLSISRKTIASITETVAEQLLRLNRGLAKLNRSNQYRDCLQLFTQIHSSQTPKPDHYTLSAALTACARLRDVGFGSQLHAQAIQIGLKGYPHVANTLLAFYAKAEDLDSVKWVFGEIENPDVYSWTTMLSACTKLGHAEYACEVFDEMPHRDLAIWNAIITGCVENGRVDVGFDYYREMHRMGIRHDNYSFASVLSVCSWEILDFGREVHLLVMKTGFLGRTSVVNALITMYFNCGLVADAYKVFEEVEDMVYDQITFNVMIDGLVSVGRDEEALIMFKEMKWACFLPTELTFVSLMSSCSAFEVAQQLYAEAIKLGFGVHTSVGNAAITMYSSCGDLGAARLVFQRLQEKDIISWNSIISSYTQGNQGQSAILDYLQMQRAEIKPDEFTFGSLLASSESIDIVEMVHALVSKNGLILKIQVSNALVSAYSKHGEMDLSHLAFEQINPKNLISWNTIISGFLLNGFTMEGLEQFSKMVISETRPNVYTFTIVLSICSSLSALRQGKQVHGYVIRIGLFQETCLGNSLVTMYAKCGVLDWSVKVFNAMIERETISYNAMISAYSQHGQGEEAVHCFEAMQSLSTVKPDQATFTAVLSACSHSGLVNDGTRIFNSMVNNYGFTPGIDHFSCIADLLSRGGYLDELETMINSKHLKAHSNMWWSLFSACAVHGNIRLGRIVAGILLENEQNNPSVYVMLANIYAATDQWEEAANVRELMRSTGTNKEPGCSWITS